MVDTYLPLVTIFPRNLALYEDAFYQRTADSWVQLSSLAYLCCMDTSKQC